VKNRVPILIVIACLVMAFIAFEVHSVLSELNPSSADSGGGSSQRGGPGGFDNPPKPTIAYPELCMALVELDGNKKLTAAQRKKIVPLIQELDQYSAKMHDVEQQLQDALDPKQLDYVQANRDKYMKQSVQPGKPPLEVAKYQFGLATSRNGGR